MYKSTSKNEYIRGNEGNWKEQNDAVERSEQKERKNTNTNEHNVISSTKEKIEKLKDRFEKHKGNIQSYDFSTMNG